MIPNVTIKEMWATVYAAKKFPSDYVKAVEWAIKAEHDKKMNPDGDQTLLDLTLGNLAWHAAKTTYDDEGVDLNYYCMYARVQIELAWCTSIARAKSRDKRRTKDDRKGWRKTALWIIPKMLFGVWRHALKYHSPLIWAPAYLRDDNLPEAERVTNGMIALENRNN